MMLMTPWPDSEVEMVGATTAVTDATIDATMQLIYTLKQPSRLSGEAGVISVSNILGCPSRSAAAVPRLFQSR